MACLLAAGDAVPAVLKGATAVNVDETGLWKLLLAREMKRSGLSVDLNRVL